jgi:hypothetical protein
MPIKNHLKLLVQGVVVWAMFWVIGLPDYYQQYSTAAVGVGCTLLSVVISLFALYVLMRGRPQTRMSRAIWISVYYTVPFAILDTLYCGLYLGNGWSYLGKYWYLTVFYFSPWVTFPPTAWLLAKMDGKAEGRRGKSEVSMPECDIG